MAPGMTPGDTSHYPQEAHWCSWSGAGKGKLSAPGRSNSLPQPYLLQYWVLASAPFIKYYFKRNASKWNSMEEAREETILYLAPSSFWPLFWPSLYYLALDPARSPLTSRNPLIWFPYLLDGETILPCLPHSFHPCPPKDWCTQS